jgi:hypothetical protein
MESKGDLSGVKAWTLVAAELAEAPDGRSVLKNAP